MAKCGILLGKGVIVSDSKNTSLVGLQGKIANETKHTLAIQPSDMAADDAKTVQKHICTFIIDGVAVDGRDLVGRAHERLQQKWKKK